MRQSICIASTYHQRIFFYVLQAHLLVITVLYVTLYSAEAAAANQAAVAQAAAVPSNRPPAGISTAEQQRKRERSHSTTDTAALNALYRPEFRYHRRHSEDLFPTPRATEIVPRMPEPGYHRAQQILRSLQEPDSEEKQQHVHTSNVPRPPASLVANMPATADTTPSSFPCYAAALSGYHDGFARRLCAMRGCMKGSHNHIHETHAAHPVTNIALPRPYAFDKDFSSHIHPDHPSHPIGPAERAGIDSAVQPTAPSIAPQSIDMRALSYGQPQAASFLTPAITAPPAQCASPDAARAFYGPSPPNQGDSTHARATSYDPLSYCD